MIIIRFNLLDALDALGSGHQLEPELGVHHLSQTACHHIPRIGKASWAQSQSSGH